MKLNFTLTPEDVIHFNRYHLRQSTGLIRRLFPYLIFLGFLIYVVYHSWNEFTWATALIIFITAILFFMLIMGNQLLIRWHVKKIIKGNPSLTGQREIEVNNGKLFYRFNDKENQYNVNELVRVYENKHAIYIFDTRSFAIIVPQHAFDSPKQKETFLGYVQAN
jgi:hypothetical protein